MSESLLKIGQVHALLRGEFPSLELSKIRYYEDMGLVVPSRTKKGYRLYSEGNIECLREAIRLADEELLPLRVIRLRLIDKGLLTGEPVVKPVTKRAARAAHLQAVSMAVPHNDAPTRSPRSEQDESPRPTLQVLPPASGVVVPLDTMPETMGITEFVGRSGVEPAVLNRLIAAGIVQPLLRGGEQVVGANDVAIARACANLLRNGADVRVLASLRRVVEREVGILHDVTATIRATVRNADESRVALLGAQADLALLRQLMLQKELDDFFDR